MPDDAEISITALLPPRRAVRGVAYLASLPSSTMSKRQRNIFDDGIKKVAFEQDLVNESISSEVPRTPNEVSHAERPALVAHGGFAAGFELTSE